MLRMVFLPEILASDLEDGSIVALQTNDIPSGELFAIGTHAVRIETSMRSTFQVTILNTLDTLNLL